MFAKTHLIKINQLADKIILVIKNIYQPQLYKQSVAEIQIDCAWSVATKNKYFNFQKKIEQNGIQNLPLL